MRTASTRQSVRRRRRVQGGGGGWGRGRCERPAPGNPL